VGLITVLGIAARNGSMLVSHYRHLEEREGMAFSRELVLRGARERLTPILMTALVTALALLPLAVLGERPGQEIEHPMVQVIIGGLLISTALNLFFLPVMYSASGTSETSAVPAPPRGVARPSRPRFSWAGRRRWLPRPVGVRAR